MIVLKNKALLTIMLAMLVGAGLSLAALLVAPMDRAGAAFQGTNGKIAFASNRNNGPADFDIYTLTPGGGVSPLLGASTAVDQEPNWSSDGTKIAFSSNRNNAQPADFDIYTVNADGTDLTLRTGGTPVDKNPAFSPDGNKITFERTAGVTDIFTVNADGRNITPVTNGLGASVSRQPNWSPDGNKIAFSSNRNNAQPADFDIYTLTLGGGVDQVTSGTAADSVPAY